MYNTHPLYTCNATVFLRTNFFSDATHIFDGLGEFPTHVGHLRFGSFVVPPTAWPFRGAPESTLLASSLYHVALDWLKKDREYRRELEKAGRKKRGARRDDVCNYVILTVAACHIMLLN